MLIWCIVGNWRSSRISSCARTSGHQVLYRKLKKENSCQVSVIHKMNESWSNFWWLQNWFSKLFLLFSIYFRICMKKERWSMYDKGSGAIESNKLLFNEAITYLSLWLWHLFEAKTKQHWTRSYSSNRKRRTNCCYYNFQVVFYIFASIASDSIEFYWKCYSIIHLFHNFFFSFSMKHEWRENDKWFLFLLYFYQRKKKKKKIEKQLQLSTKYTILCRTIDVSISVWVNYIMVLQ